MENVSPRPSRIVHPTVPPVQPAIQPQTRPAARHIQVDTSVKQVGYGLPCASCRTYYAADLTACPVCKSPQRVLPTAAPVYASQVAEKAVSQGNLEEERERFLKEFKSQIYAAHMQINAAASFRCSLEENHQAGYEPAAVCQTCYTLSQERVDQMEAALHMDVKEAAQIVYDAVWSDPSDSNKTYVNAAQALLSELRKRAGISLVLSPLKPLAH
ncbi:MAG TPA: hypothetical protein VFJ47_02565 [Terriglobales bacterium]|nr:hypothetical protein [Terriglobales bacterium]